MKTILEKRWTLCLSPQREPSPSSSWFFFFLIPGLLLQLQRGLLASSPSWKWIISNLVPASSWTLILSFSLSLERDERRWYRSPIVFRPASLLFLLFFLLSLLCVELWGAATRGHVIRRRAVWNCVFSAVKIRQLGGRQEAAACGEERVWSQEMGGWRDLPRYRLLRDEPLIRRETWQARHKMSWHDLAIVGSVRCSGDGYEQRK